MTWASSATTPAFQAGFWQAEYCRVGTFILIPQQPLKGKQLRSDDQSSKGSQRQSTTYKISHQDILIVLFL